MYDNDKTPRNKYGQEHGHWQLHWHDGPVMFDYQYVNGVELGIFTKYEHNGLIEEQIYYLR